MAGDNTANITGVDAAIIAGVDAATTIHKANNPIKGGMDYSKSNGSLSNQVGKRIIKRPHE